MREFLRGQIKRLRTSSLKNDTFFYGSAAIAERFISILIIPLLTKTIPQEIYGVWTQMIITAGLLSPILLVGFYTSMVRFLAGNKNNQETSSVFHGMLGIVVFNSFLFVAITCVFTPSVSRIMFGDLRFFPFVYLFAFFLTAQVLFEMAIAFLRARTEIRLLSMYYLLKNGGRIGILAIGILLLHLNLFYTIIFIVISQLLLIFFIYIKNIYMKIGFYFAIRNIRWKEIMFFSFPLIPYAFFIWVNNFVDRYLILHILNINQVAVYAVSYSLAGLIGLFNGILGFTLYPHMAHLWNEGKRDGAAEILSKAIAYYLFFTIPSIAILAILSTPIITIVSAAEYIANWQVVFWLGIGVGMFGFYELHVLSILLANKTSLTLKISAAALIVNIILNIIMIPKIGILGAAISTSISNTILACWTILIGRKYIPYSFPWRAFAKTGFSTVVIALFLVSVRRYFEIDNIYMLASAIISAAIIYGLVDLLSRRSLLLQLMRNL
jgi:O-antigen/teichoic acid export membrane protein